MGGVCGSKTGAKALKHARAYGMRSRVVSACANACALLQGRVHVREGVYACVSPRAYMLLSA